MCRPRSKKSNVRPGDYKAAVKALSEGRVAEGFNRLDALGWVREIPDDERTSNWPPITCKPVAKGKTALVVSPTHAEGDRITDEIRDVLRKKPASSKPMSELSASWKTPV